MPLLPYRGAVSKLPIPRTTTIWLWYTGAMVAHTCRIRIQKANTSFVACNTQYHKKKTLIPRLNPPQNVCIVIVKPRGGEGVLSQGGRWMSCAWLYLDVQNSVTEDCCPIVGRKEALGSKPPWLFAFIRNIWRERTPSVRLVVLIVRSTVRAPS